MRELTLLFLLFSSSVFAQNKTCNCLINGNVKDEKTKENIVGALVTIQEAKLSVFTNENGNYTFTGLCEGIYHIECKIIGYEAIHKEVNLKHHYEENFLLNESEIHLQEIEVKAEKIESLNKNVDVLSTDALNEKSGENLGNLLASLTGVSVLQTGNSIAKPVIHGMHSNRILIINNGIRLESQQWGSEHAPEIDPSVAQKITLIKGASGVKYGADAIAGIILITPASIFVNKPQLNFVSNYFSNGNLISSAITYTTPIKKTNFYTKFNISAKKSGDIYTPNYRLANTGFTELDYSFAGAYKKNDLKAEFFVSQFNSKIGIFSGSHFGNITDLIDAINRPQPLAIYTPEKFTYAIGRPYQDLQHTTLKLNFEYRFSQSTLEWNLSRQQNFRKEVDILRGDKNLSQSFSLINYSSNLNFEKRLNKNWNFSLGNVISTNSNISTGELKNPLRSSVLLPNYQQITAADYLILKENKEKLELEFGLRHEYRWLSIYQLTNQVVENTKHQNNVLVGTIGLSFFPTKQTSFYTNLSTAQRPPAVNEWYSDGVHHGSASFEKGDLNLKKEKAINYVLGGNWLRKKFSVEASAYFHYITDYIYLAPTGATILTVRGAFPYFQYAQTNAVFVGSDIVAGFTTQKKISFTNKLSLLWANDMKNQQPLPYISPSKNEFEIGYDVHSDWLNEIKINYLFVSKQKRVPTSNIFDLTQNDVVFKDYGGDFLPPPPAYQLLSLQFKNKFELKNKANFIVNLEIKNLLNTVYRDYLNRFRYFSDEMGRNFQLHFNYFF